MVSPAANPTAEPVLIVNYIICPNHWTKINMIFVELGGGVGDVLVWHRGGAYVEFGFRWRCGLTDVYWCENNHAT